MRFTRLCASAVLFVGATAVIPAQVADDPASFISRVESAQVPNRQGFDGLTVAQLMERFHVPGVSVAVIKDFKIHWAKAYGVADVGSKRSVEIGSMFQAASISKPVTAMAAMRLVQRGVFALDDDVNRHLKSWRVPASAHTATQPVTPRSLFSHTSGADDGFGFPGYEPSAPRPSVVQVLDGQAPSSLGPVRFARAPFQAQSTRVAASRSCNSCSPM